MPWLSPSPRDNSWTERDYLSFLREIHRRIMFDSFTWNPPNVPANSTVDTTLTSTTVPQLSGLRPGMAVSITPPSTIDAGLTVGGWVASSDSLTIRLGNVTAGAINPGSATWAFSGVMI